jgi:cysteine desulfurase
MAPYKNESLDYNLISLTSQVDDLKILRDRIHTMSSKVAYFDYAATTPLDAEVLQAMLPFFSEDYGNPASMHIAGQRAEAAVELSRLEVAALINSRADEIIFTSGATESNNLALRGLALKEREQRGATHILTTAVEHPSVIETCRQLAQHWGFTLDWLPIDETGQVQIETVKTHLRQNTAFVSVIYANNEIGTINPVSEIGLLCRERGIPFHSDAAQAANHLALDVDQLNVDLMTLGAHKFYGPKGSGVLFHRNHQPLISSQTGGSQEFGTRAGTHNVPSIVGFAKALSIARALQSELTPRLTSWRDKIIASMENTIPDAILTGHHQERLSNHISFAFKDIDSNQLLAALDMAGFACSSGSACKIGNPEPSQNLLALGLEPAWALGALRISLGRETQMVSIDSLLSDLPTILARLRSRQDIPQ